MTVHLISPDPALAATHASFITEFQARGEALMPWVLDESRSSFKAYVAWLRSAANGADLPPGFVAHSTFWLVNAAQEILGVTNIRHELTPALREYGGHIGYGVRPSVRRRGHATELLRLSLVQARRLGINRVRVTCDCDNTASASTILRNGGELDDEVYLDAVGHRVRRYWINN